MSSRHGAEQETEDHRPVPVLVLGAHRSGTSAVTGLLARASGLRLGDVMPPTAANPRGYFESTAIVRAHNLVLDGFDRDWTCPPDWFDPADVPLGGLADHVDELFGDATPWGVKDPRLLFMLPAWAELLDRVRFVGVLRDHEEVVRSLVARDGIDPGVADAIARAHIRRLRRLRDQWAFPVVDFSAPVDQTLDTVRNVAKWLELPFDEEVARGFLDPSLASNRARGALDNPDVDHLRDLADQAWDPEPIDTDVLADFLASLAGDTDELDRYSGPRTSARRRRVWSVVPRELVDAVEFTRNLRIASSVDPAPDHATVVEVRDLHAVYDELRLASGPPEAVVLPDLTSWVHRDDLVGALELVHEFVDDHGFVAIGVSRADAATCRSMGREPVAPHELATMAREAGFLVLGHDDDDRLTVLKLLARSTTDGLLRRVLAEGGLAETSGARTQRPRSLREGRTGGDTTGSTATAVRKAAGTEPPRTNDDWRRKYERLRRRRGVRVAVAAADGARSLRGLLAGGGGSASRDSATSTPRRGSGMPTNGSEREPVTDWQARYEDFEGRRSVSLALDVADRAKPAVALVRRVRARLR